MKLKEILELRNILLDEADGLVAAAETETRSLEDTEQHRFKEITDEVRSLNLQIKEIELGRLEGEQQNQMEEQRDMDIKEKELEVRGFEHFLRGQDTEEVRTLATTTTGAAVIPTNIEGMIVKKMEETAPVFAKARKFPSVNGTLRIAKENDTTVAGFVGEGSDIGEGALAFESVDLTQKRVGAALTLSNQLINDAAVDIVGYAAELLGRRAGKAVEKSILVGTGAVGKEFVGITTDADIAAVPVTGAVGVTDLLDLYNAINPTFLNGSVFIIQRTAFNAIAKLQDLNGHFYLQNGTVNGRLSYTLFGAEVIVTDALVAGTPVLFGNVEEAYAVMVKQGFSLKHVTADTKQALAGTQALIFDGYMDGAVYNPQAMAKMTVA